MGAVSSHQAESQSYHRYPYTVPSCMLATVLADRFLVRMPVLSRQLYCKEGSRDVSEECHELIDRMVGCEVVDSENQRTAILMTKVEPNRGDGQYFVTVAVPHF